jgi:hypothetical protein
MSQYDRGNVDDTHGYSTGGGAGIIYIYFFLNLSYSYLF